MYRVMSRRKEIQQVFKIYGGEMAILGIDRSATLRIPGFRLRSSADRSAGLGFFRIRQSASVASPNGKRVKRFWCVGSTVDNNNNRAMMAQRGIEDYMEVEGHIDPDVQRNVSSLITAVSLSFFNSI